jgi:hypothetical protein
MPEPCHADVEAMRMRLALVLLPAAGLAAADLAIKALVKTPSWNFHQRSHGWVGLSILLLLGAVALAFVPSRAVSLAAGVVAGGVLGNLVSAAWYGGRVPDPIVLGGRFGSVAFTLADVLVLDGILMLVVALVEVSIRKRDRLIPPRRWERAVWARLRGETD